MAFNDAREAQISMLHQYAFVIKQHISHTLKDAYSFDSALEPHLFKRYLMSGGSWNRDALRRVKKWVCHALVDLCCRF